MKRGTVVGIIIGIGLLVLLKVFQNSIPRISDPLTNYIILTSVILFAIVYVHPSLEKVKNRM